MQLLDFLNESPTAFHVTDNAKKLLTENGFSEIFEDDNMPIKKGGKYFVTRNLSSIIAFCVPKNEYSALSVCASHTDSPSLKLKSNPELPPQNGLIRLNVEGYGGMIKESWFDRPLSVAGRITVSDNGLINEILVDIPRPIAVIPSLAIHMGSPNGDGKTNIQNELLPIVYSSSSQHTLKRIVAQYADVDPERIMGADLYLYNRQAPTLAGLENEFICSPRIDNIESVFLSLSAFIKSDESDRLKIFAAFDNEETGSLTRQGAESTFFTDTIERINESLNISKVQYLRALSSSFMMSADNAHAAHPNYISKADIVNRPQLNGGIVLKFNASGKYTTDAVSAAAVRMIAKKASVPVQEYHNRSDIPGGSTLGNLMNRRISMRSADIGLAQLAMHSSYETAGVKDAEYMESFLTEFYNTDIRSEQGKLVLL